MNVERKLLRRVLDEGLTDGLRLEIENFLAPPVIVPGDKVRHVDHDDLSSGTVLELSKSGKRVLVRWDADLFEPWARNWVAHYPIEKLEKLE